jgi:glyoxylase-like metal-dependent hydrolase (beta-lactamase superfamily II)
MQKIISKEVKFKDGFGKIHAISTGTVSVKKNFKQAKGGSMLSKINFMMDKEYTEPLPIWVWVIEHPEGIFLIDTGENADVNDKGYFKREGIILNWINITQFKFQVEQAEEIGAQLTNINLSPQDIGTVVLTHLHLDHIDGLKYFKNSEILVNEYEWKHPSFALPSLYPEWFVPTLVNLRDKKYSAFSKSFSLTEANDLMLVATPGHTKGHCSVLAIPEDHSYFFAGDVTYDQQQLVDETFAGAHQDFKLAKNTYQSIKKYATENKTVYLPSHDSHSAVRLIGDISLSQ